MEGLSTFSNGTSLDSLEVETGGLFYELFPVYLKDNCSKGNVQPVPVLVGNGEQVDLYKLFSLVKEKGGYTVVSEKGLWDSVTKELGFNPKACQSLKLVYCKYQHDFERWLKKTLEKKNLKNDNNPLDAKDKNNKYEDVQLIDGDNDEKSCNVTLDDPATLGAKGSEKEFNSCKRKREELSGMLNWMKHIAKHPLNPLAQLIPKPSNWKEYKGQDIFDQFLRAREFLSQKLHGEPNSGLSSFRKKLKMHKDRAAKRVPFSRQKQVSVGPNHQAEVPEWTGVVSESDLKLLGTKVWPLNDSEHAAETSLGRGRQEKCNCELQGSDACVKLHVAENSMKLKLDLGSVFYHWGFPVMGKEEVSLKMDD